MKEATTLLNAAHKQVSFVMIWWCVVSLALMGGGVRAGPGHSHTPGPTRAHHRAARNALIKSLGDLGLFNFDWSFPESRSDDASSREGRARGENADPAGMSKKACTAGKSKGVCMWVQECNRAGGKHAGVCVDGFMFGSCCLLPQPVTSTSSSTVSETLPHSSLKVTEKPFVAPSTSEVWTTHATTLHSIAKPQPIQTQRPAFMTKPIDGSAYSYRPPELNFPALGGTTDGKNKNHNEQNSVSSVNKHTDKLNEETSHSNEIHSSPTAVLRPGKPIISSQDNQLQETINVHRLRPNVNMNAIWQTASVTSEPNFITKPRPASWDKPNSMRPAKPTKKFTTTTPKMLTSKPKPLKPIKPFKATTNGNGDTITENSVLYTTSASNNVECGVSKMSHRPETRIVGGKDATFGRWPWQVSVRRTSFFGFSSTHRCGGAILNEGWIATAGHCVDDLLTSQIRIRVGEYDFSNAHERYPFIERGVARKAVHPKYNFFTYEYDLALVKLESALDFAPHIAPICLPASDDALVGRNATVTGWGRLSEGGTLPSVLQEVQVPIVSNDRCAGMFLRAGRREHIPDIFLCAGHERGGHDSCQGDSGGPLQVRGKDQRFFLAGIISWGIGCAEANLPGVCTRISKFVPWILKTVAENSTLTTTTPAA